MIAFEQISKRFFSNLRFKIVIFSHNSSSKRTEQIGNKLSFLILCICLLSIGGFLRSAFLITYHSTNFISTFFQNKKTIHLQSLLNIIDLNLDETIKVTHGIPPSTINLEINKASIPEIILNKRFTSFLKHNSLNQLLIENNFQYSVPSKPVTIHKANLEHSLFGCPSEGRITSHFGKRTDPVYEGTAFHKGIDIGTPVSTPVLATAQGVVIFAGNRSRWGNVIIVNHDKNYQSIYAHLHKFNATKGDTISRGQIIGFSGNTGKSTGPHLHYEIRHHGEPVDPLPFLVPDEQVAD